MDKKFAAAKIAYGMTHEVFASARGESDTVTVGGISPQDQRWSRMLTRRAAHLLWYQLTCMLFPEKSTQVTAMAQTAPLRDVAQTDLTTHLELMRNDEAHTVYVFGWIGHEKDVWWFAVDEHTARHLWTALDLALYPAGWQGPATKHRALN